jgi:RNA polymerase sigma factor (sigma-70 family)
MAAAEESDAVLAARARNGDRDAFNQVILRHKAPLYRFVRRYIGNADDAYDVLQETFLAAWLALKRYDAARNFSAWLGAIALNKCRDFGRRQAVRTKVMRLFAVLGVHHATTPDAAEDDLKEDENMRALDAAIAALPAFYKEPLLLTTVSGLSQQETATQLRTTPKAVEMRVRRAKLKLEETLKETGAEPGTRT